MTFRSEKVTQAAGILIFGIWGLTLCIAMAFAIAPEFVDLRGTTNWPQVQGTILVSEVTSRDYVSDGSEITSYSPRFVYRFTYKETEYEVEGFERGYIWRGAHDFRDPVPHKNLVAQHPVGSEVTVYVNPRNPGESVIYPDDGSDANIGRLIAVVFNSIFLLIGLGCTIGG